MIITYSKSKQNEVRPHSSKMFSSQNSLNYFKKEVCFIKVLYSVSVILFFIYYYNKK